MSRFEYTLTARDGLRLYGQGWAPAQPRAVAALVHGLGDHSGRYAHVGGFLVQAGCALLAADLRGHGRSQGPRGHSPSYLALMDDIAALLAEAQQRWPGRPLFLYGHSLGGNLVLNFVLRRQPDLAGAIATSPLLRPAVPPPAWKRTVGQLTYTWLPRLRLATGLDQSALSRDPEVVRAYATDPLVHDRISARLGLDMLAAGEWALAHVAELRLPLLLMHGAADRLTDAQASRAFARAAGPRCTLRIWDSYYHELHNEPGQAEVLSALAAWLAAQTAAAGAAV